MRAHYAFTLTAVILLALGVKLFFFSAPSAEAVVRPAIGLGLDVSNMHVNKVLAVQEMHDLTFVFADAD